MSAVPVVYLVRRGGRAVLGRAVIPTEHPRWKVEYALTKLGTEPSWVAAEGVWRLDRTRAAKKLARTLADHYGSTWLVTISNGPAKLCTGPCLRANPDYSALCECVCQGLFHGEGEGASLRRVGDDLHVVQHGTEFRTGMLIHGSSS
ncbi:hypothetical protein EEW87_004340 [Janibacter melonis]|uniref:Uncharacterized protein n=1 Tax=Janibacter melonis TaxID=262209 RepID=A0A5P8FKC6_9MICO|nr:hypothetical protein [Janibacter melonis]QFQ29728.2 hypothetical protein EEW87_004340 [Janibacter melonis]